LEAETEDNKMKISTDVQKKINEALKRIEIAERELKQAKSEVLSIEFYLENESIL
jgi:hypothetical protein